MGILPFGMVTILLLTLVSNSTLPLKLWSSNTVSPYSTWTGLGNQVSRGRWEPSEYVTTFYSGVKVQKIGYESLIDIDPPLNGRIIYPTTISNSYLLLRNNGNLDQTADGRTSLGPIYSSKTAPVFAPIQLAFGASTRCITAVRTNNVTTLNACMGRADNQRWMLNSNSQVFNNRTSTCLDVAADFSARSNKCDSKKSTQKWHWDNGYLKLTATGKCLKVKSASGTAFSLETGLCTGPRMAWNK